MPKRTYQPKKRKYSKKHGFRKRSKTTTGKNIIQRRRKKGRKQVSVTSKGSAKSKTRK